MSRHGWIVGLAVLFATLPPSALSAEQEPVFLGGLMDPFTTLVVEGELGHPGKTDWYSFAVATSGGTAVWVEARSLSEAHGVRVLVFDSQESYLEGAEDGSIELTLDAGTYLVRVDSLVRDAVSYSLSIHNGVERESNDGLLEADDLGWLTASIRLSASLLPPGDADFFRFAVAEAGFSDGRNAVLIETLGSGEGDTTLVLYTFDEAARRYLPVAFDDDSGDGYWSRILITAQPGAQHAVRVEETAFPLGGITGYTLSISAVMLGIDEEPNDSLDRATALPPTSPDGERWEANGVLETGDDLDFYRVAIANDGLVEIRTLPQRGLGNFDTLLTVYGADGSQIAENDDGGAAGWSRVLAVLDEGSYFVSVAAAVSGMGLAPYCLQVTAAAARSMDEVEPNDAPEQAYAVGWRAGENLLILAAIEPAGDIDAFLLVLQEPATISCETGSRPGEDGFYDTTLTVYDEELEEVAFNDDADVRWSRIEATLPAGTYYIVVEGYYDDASFPYALLVRGSYESSQGSREDADGN